MLSDDAELHVTKKKYFEIHHSCAQTMFNIIETTIVENQFIDGINTENISQFQRCIWKSNMLDDNNDNEVLIIKLNIINKFKKKYYGYKKYKTFQNKLLMLIIL